MPAYFFNSKIDFSINRYLMASLNVNGFANESIVIPGNSSVEYNFITPVFFPNTTITKNLQTASWLLTHPVTSMAVSFEVIWGVCNFDATIIRGQTTQTGPVTSTNSFIGQTPIVTGLLCSDRIFFNLKYTNGNMNQQNISLDLNSPNCRLITPFEHNTGSCDVLRKPIHVNSYKS